MNLAIRPALGEVVDPSNLIQDANGNYYDTLTSRTYMYNEMSGGYELLAWANEPVPGGVLAPTTVATTTNVPAVVPSPSPNPGAVATVGGVRTAVQAPVSQYAGQWANGMTILPSLQSQLGLNNLSFSAVAGLLGLTLLASIGGGGYAGYRYGKR